MIKNPSCFCPSTLVISMFFGCVYIETINMAYIWEPVHCCQFLLDEPLPTIGLVPSSQLLLIFWTLCCSSISRNSLQLSINVTRFCYRKTVMLCQVPILVSPACCLCILMAIVCGVRTIYIYDTFASWHTWYICCDCCRKTSQLGACRVMVIFDCIFLMRYTGETWTLCWWNM